MIDSPGVPRTPAGALVRQGPVAIAAVPVDGGVLVAASGHVGRFSTEAGPAVARINAGGPIRAEELPEDLRGCLWRWRALASADEA